MKLMENCSVVGASVGEEGGVIGFLYEGLSALQHRGQESVGVSVLDGCIKTFRSMGLTADSEIFINSIEGHMGIGHERYSTSGRSILENAQPLEMRSKNGVKYSFAFNGNIRNLAPLRSRVEHRSPPSTDSDAWVLARLLGEELGGKQLERTYREQAPLIDGSYSALMLVEGKRPRIVALRDPLGIRPLCLGKRGDDHFIASESVAFSDCYIGAEFLRDVEPGEVVTLDQSGLHSCRVFDCPRHGHCMFEWVYFSRIDSVVEGIAVHRVREALGRLLAERSPLDTDMVVPVPDSGRSAAAGYSMASSTPLREAFQLDRYAYRRIFIMPDQATRERRASKKLNIIPSIVKGKKILVVDDSIVRGTNMRRMVINKLKKSGAEEIHIRVSCPPIMNRCPYGVDFHKGELIAAKYQGLSHQEVCKGVCEELGANSLYYNTLEDLEKAIGLGKRELCTGCLTGEYPLVDWRQNYEVT